MKGLQPITDQVDLVNSQCTVTKYRGPDGHIWELAHNLWSSQLWSRNDRLLPVLLEQFTRWLFLRRITNVSYDPLFVHCSMEEIFSNFLNGTWPDYCYENMLDGDFTPTSGVTNKQDLVQVAVLLFHFSLLSSMKMCKNSI